MRQVTQNEQYRGALVASTVPYVTSASAMLVAQLSRSLTLVTASVRLDQACDTNKELNTQAVTFRTQEIKSVLKANTFGPK